MHAEIVITNNKCVRTNQFEQIPYLDTFQYVFCLVFFQNLLINIIQNNLAIPGNSKFELTATHKRAKQEGNTYFYNISLDMSSASK